MDLNLIAQDNELKLYKDMKWTIWEIVEYVDSKTGKNIKEDDYDKLLRKIAWFDNMIQFHQAWNKIPHAKISQILMDTENSRFRV